MASGGGAGAPACSTRTLVASWRTTEPIGQGALRCSPGPASAFTIRPKRRIIARSLDWITTSPESSHIVRSPVSTSQYTQRWSSSEIQLDARADPNQ